MTDLLELIRGECSQALEEKIMNEIERLRQELRWIAIHDTYWTSGDYDDGKTEILERSTTGNIRVRGQYGKRALSALRAE